MFNANPDEDCDPLIFQRKKVIDDDEDYDPNSYEAVFCLGILMKKNLFWITHPTRLGALSKREKYVFLYKYICFLLNIIIHEGKIKCAMLIYEGGSKNQEIYLEKSGYFFIHL